jgi:tRNA dimethylallyltransferase
MIYALAITGPTAGGKTALSLELCKNFEAEIISCDSMQIYRGMDIGTAKATAEERRSVPHHMIDIISPDVSFSAADYKELAMPVAKDIAARGKLPVFVGGTGLYIDTVKRSFSGQAPESRAEYREELLKGVKTEEDRIALWERLRSVDEKSAEQIHYNNLKRVMRALEIYDATGKPKSYFDSIAGAPSEEITIVHVTIDFHQREKLYERIDARVDKMITDGLLAEVEALRNGGFLDGNTTAGGAIGYKEIITGAEEGPPIAEVIENIKRASRNYAKRQLTWFRHTEGAITLYADADDGTPRSTDELYGELVRILKNYPELELKARAKNP